MNTNKIELLAPAGGMDALRAAVRFGANAVYLGGPMLQLRAGNTGFTLEGDVAEKLKIEDILTSYGYQRVIIVDPQDLAAMEQAVQDALASDVPAAIITRRPCLLIKRIKHNTALCEVDADKCIGCKKCLKVGCPAVMMENKKSRIDPTQCVGCTVCAQVCPKDAITRKER